MTRRKAASKKPGGTTSGVRVPAKTRLPHGRDRKSWPPDPRRVASVLRALDRLYPRSRCSLTHKDPWQLLVSTILSAQCTDSRVNQVTRKLFKVAPNAAALAALPRKRVEELVLSTGFFRNKARAIQESSAMIQESFGGRVPASMEDLLKLPGVARKTANVVLGTGFGQAVGVVVDTHVIRISQLLGFTKEKTPIKIEKELMEILPQKRWISFTHQIIDHGRAVCIARRPACQRCGLKRWCPSAS